MKKQSGFTLIEIMVVVAVIALLGAMLAPTIFGKVQQAQETRIAQDIRTLESALKFYRLDTYRYPTGEQGLRALFEAPQGENNWKGPYLESVPLDPWGVEYRYANPGRHGKEINIYTFGADEQEGGEGVAKDWGNWNIQ